MNKQRLDYIDILKGIGILFVIFSHSGAEGWLMDRMGDFFVPLFFVASGYTFTFRQQPFGSSLARRAGRLLKPYFFFSLLLLLLYKRFSWLDVIGVVYSRYCLFPYHTANNVFLMGGGNPPLWFLTSMLTAFVPFFFIVKFEKQARWILLFFVLFTFGCQYLPVLLPWGADTMCLTAAFMYTGFLLRRKAFLFEKSPYIFCFIAVAFVAVCLYNGSDNLSVREYGRSFLLYYLASSLAAIVLMWLSKQIENSFLSGLLVSLGRHSLVVFCVQMFLLRLCHQFFHAVLHFPTEGLLFYGVSMVKVLLVAVIGIAISKALNKYLPWLFK